MDVLKVIQDTVNQANKLRLKYCPDYSAHVGYCAFFSQNMDEFEQAIKFAKKNGTLCNDTPTGPVYIINSIKTDAGNLQVFKVRLPDVTRKERGDADFSLEGDFKAFKKAYIHKKGFKLIEREEYEMIELMDSNFDVRVYFSNPPVEEHKEIKKALKLYEKKY